MDECEKLRLDIIERKKRQSARRETKGLAPRHKIPKERAKPTRTRQGSNKPPLPESGDVQDSAMSFDEWKEAGFSIKKGQKADHFDMLGTPQFLMTQVQKTNPSWVKWRSK